MYCPCRASASREQSDAMVTVSADGTVSWYPHEILESMCTIDITNYPFDTQQCDIVLGTWVYTIHEIDIHVS